jgi:hypothetical protein
MTARAVLSKERLLSGGMGASGAGAVGLAKLAEDPFHMSKKIQLALAVPAQVGLVEGGAVERGDEVATRKIASIGLPLRQFFAQSGHPAAEGAQKAAADIRLLKHQPQHLLGMAGIVHLLAHDGEDGVFQRRQRISGPRLGFKPVRYPLAEMLHAEGKQLLLGAEVAEKGAPGDAGVAADLLYGSPVKTDGGKQVPRRLFDLPEDKLVFPFAKRPGILKFRPLFAAGRLNRFLHSMQIMAQSAVL